MQHLSQLVSLFVAITISIMLIGCYGGPSATAVYGRASNPDRKVRGLPIIPATWIERPGGGPQADWYNPACSNSATTHDLMHKSKTTLLDFKTGNLWREDDEYQSGKQYTSKGGEADEMFWETLTITYDFAAAKAGKNPWSGHVNCGPLQNPGHELTLDECEAILKAWGLKRLD